MDTIEQTSINHIATMACQITKIEKDACFDIVRDLIESGAAPDEHQLAHLYNFFLAAQPAAPKTPLEWIRKAVAGKNEVRNYLQYIYSDYGTTVAMDGHRMHFATNIEQTTEPGYYSPQGIKVDYDQKYPNWKQIIPETNTSQTVTLADCEIREITHKGKKFQVVNVTGKTWITRKYLLDAIGKEATFTILNNDTCQDGLYSTLIQCKFGKAVIMPIRV